MKLQMKVVAILLMALVGLAQAQFNNAITAGIAVSERDMPAVMFEQHYEPNGVGVVLGAYGDLGKRDGRDFNGVDVKRLAFAMGVSYRLLLFRPYAALEYFKQMPYDEGGESLGQNTEQLEFQGGVLLSLKVICARVGFSSATNRPIITAGFRF